MQLDSKTNHQKTAKIDIVIFQFFTDKWLICWNKIHKELKRDKPDTVRETGHKIQTLKKLYYLVHYKSWLHNMIFTILLKIYCIYSISATIFVAHKDEDCGELIKKERIVSVIFLHFWDFQLLVFFRYYLQNTLKYYVCTVLCFLSFWGALPSSPTKSFSALVGKWQLCFFAVHSLLTVFIASKFHRQSKKNPANSHVI